MKFRDGDVVYTASEFLMLETLAARLRTGECLWTFPRRMKKFAISLESKGMVYWKFGIVPKTIMVFPTDKMKSEWLMSDYVIPILREKKE